MRPDVRLHIGGDAWGGWSAIRITRSLGSMAGSFELSLTERWPGQKTRRTIQSAAACQVRVDGETVVSGFIDEIGLRYDKASHELSVSGRDRTGDLVDCSAIHQGGQWQSRTLTEIARDLCAPYGIVVRVETDVGKPFSTWQIQQGETVFECLERAARIRGLLVTSSPAGDLVITRAQGGEGGRLRLGENVVACDARISWQERHSEYQTKGQSWGSDDTGPEENAASESVVKDGAVGRHRPLILLAEDHADGVSLKDRGTWERGVRMGRGRTFRYTVAGWRNQSGALWLPNTRVRVEDSFVGLEQDLLVVSVNWSLDDQGSRTELELQPAEAWARLPMPEEEAGWPT